MCAAAFMAIGGYAWASSPDGADGLTEQVQVLDDPNCPDGHGCVWTGGSYTGQKGHFGAGYAAYNWVDIGGSNRFFSAKNRYGNRKFQLAEYVTGGNPSGVVCLNPGENRPSLSWPGIKWFRVGQAGSSC